MRLAGLGLALAVAAAAAAGGSAAAEAPVSAQPLAPGEVLLELGAIGTSTTPADLATVIQAVAVEGDSDAAARAALRTRVQHVVDAARRAGVPAAAIVEGEVNAAPSSQTFDLADVPPPEATRAPSRTASTVISVRVTDMRRLQAVRAALAEAGGTDLPSASYALVDSGGARSAARAQALATVRADAEAYAAALNMRVARIVRVTERTGVDMLGVMYSGGPTTRRLLGPEHDYGPDIPTVVMIGVDFALAPR